MFRGAGYKLILAFVQFALLALLSLTALAEPVVEQFRGLRLNAELKMAPGRSLEDGVVLMLPSPLGHHRMELIVNVQDVLAENESVFRVFSTTAHSLDSYMSILGSSESVLKTYDGFLKFRILRQSSGARKMPITLSYYVSTAVTSLKWEDMGVEDRTNYNSSRFSYAHQLLIARKFNSNLSLQLMPSLVHKNLVETSEDKNDIFSIGIGGRYKVTNRMSINAEYYYTPPEQMSYEFDQPFSLGLDLETGGHVFQMHFSNAAAFFERGFITETQGSWGKGDIYFGFNISRVFTIVKPKTPDE